MRFVDRNAATATCAKVRLALDALAGAGPGSGPGPGARDTAPSLDLAAVNMHVSACGACAACAACAEYRDDLPRVRAAVRSLPMSSMPASLRAEILAQTVDATSPLAGRLPPVPPRGRITPPPAGRRIAPFTRVAAAVLVLATAAAGLWLTTPSDITSDERELALLEQNVERILELVASTLIGAEDVALDDVFVGERAPLRVLSIGWPDG